MALNSKCDGQGPDSGSTGAVGDDQALMARVRAGDPSALGVLLERYWDPLVRYAAAIIEDPDSAQDIVQESFVRVWRRRESWSPSGTVSAYLYQITRNLALNMGRDGRTRQKWHDRSRGAYGSPLPPRTPDQDLEAKGLATEVRAAIDALPPRRREIFLLSRFHQLTHAEIARTMGISQQTVSNQMSSALADLRVTLAHRLSEE